MFDDAHLLLYSFVAYISIISSVIKIYNGEAQSLEKKPLSHLKDNSLKKMSIEKLIFIKLNVR